MFSFVRLPAAVALMLAYCEIAGAEPVTFVSASDTHWDDNDSHNDAKRTILASINGLAGQTFPASIGGAVIQVPRGVLVAGDCTNGGSNSAVRDQWGYWTRDFGLTGSDGTILHYPVYETWGNNDDNLIVQNGIIARNHDRVGLTAVSPP